MLTHSRKALYLRQGAYIADFGNSHRNDMFNCFDTLKLPPYDTVKKYEGKGNWAIGKYYTFPFSLFYRHKLKMIIKLVRSVTKNRRLYNIIDYGSGPGIFTKELKRHATKVYSYDVDTLLNPSWRFDMAVCSSSLEFMHLHHELRKISGILKPGGVVVVGSPMKTWVSGLYFKMIGDINGRHSHEAIISAIGNHFKIQKTTYWFGLYFTVKAVKV